MSWLSDFWEDTVDFFTEDIPNAISDAVDWVVDLFVPEVPDYSGQIEEAANQNRGTTVNRRGGEYSIPLIYSGYNQFVKLGSIQAYVSTSGTDNKFLHLTYVLCHSADINQVILGTNETFMLQGANWKDPSTTDFVRRFNLATTGVATNDITVKNKDNESVTIIKFHVQRHTGTNITQPTWHNDKNQYAGLITVKIRLEYNNKPYKDTTDPIMGKIPNIIYYVASNQSKNEVDFLYDYLTNKSYGAGFDPSLFDTSSFTTTSGLIDNIVGTRTTTSVAGTNKSYFRVANNRPVINIIQEMLGHISSTLLFSNGKFYLKADTNMVAYYNKDNTYLDNLPVFAITEKDVIGGVAFENASSSEKAWQYVNSYNQTTNNEETWPIDTVSEVKSLRNKGFKVVIPNEENRVNLNSSGHRIMKWKWAEDQIRSVITFTITAKHANIKPFDIISLNYPKINFSDEKYVVVKADLQPNMTVSVVAKRYFKDTSLGVDPNLDIGDYSFWDLLVDAGFNHIRTPVRVPAGSDYGGTPIDPTDPLYGTAPTDGNTQVDEFLPSTRAPEIANISIEVDLYESTTLNGQYIPSIHITFDEIVEPNINSYNVYFRRISKSKQYNKLMLTTQSNDFNVEAEYLYPGRKYILTIVPVTQDGIEGKLYESLVSIPSVDYNKDETIQVQFEWDKDTHPYGYVVGPNSTGDGRWDPDFADGRWDYFTEGYVSSDNICRWGSYQRSWDGLAKPIDTLYGWRCIYPYQNNYNHYTIIDQEIPITDGEYAIVTGEAEVVLHKYMEDNSPYPDNSGTGLAHFLTKTPENNYTGQDVYCYAPYQLMYIIYDTLGNVVSGQDGNPGWNGVDPGTTWNWDSGYTGQATMLIDCRDLVAANTISHAKLVIRTTVPWTTPISSPGDLRDWISIREVNFIIHKNIQIPTSVSNYTFHANTPGQPELGCPMPVPTTSTSVRKYYEVLFATGTPNTLESAFFTASYEGLGPGIEYENLKFREYGTTNYIDNISADATVVGIPNIIQDSVTMTNEEGQLPMTLTTIPKSYKIVK